ncbi:MAG TPA: HDOD domain-containing protein [Rhodocyclaceae bacterium]
MGIAGFFRNLVGGRSANQIEPTPTAPAARAQAAAPAEAPGAPAAMPKREEVLDARGRLAGYRFSRGAALAGMPGDGSYLGALAAANLKAFADRRLTIISASLSECLSEGFAALVGPRTVFELSAWLSGSEAALERIRQAGAGIAFPVAAVGTVPLLAGDIAVIDFSAYDFASFERAAKALKAQFPGVILAAENVATWSERRLCQALGIEYALGGFLATADTEDTSDKLNQSRLVLIEMLNLLRAEADAAAVAEVAKRDPGVAVQVLAMANSPVLGLASPIVGIDQAIMVLGRETLYRWLAVAVFRAGSGDHDEALLEVALARARFLELIGQLGLSKKEADELFLVGLLSFAEALLGQPMEHLAKRIHLPQPVEDVLVRSEGRYARYLRLAMVTERGDGARARELAEAVGIEAETLDAYRGVAQLWAEEALRQNRS